MSNGLPNYRTVDNSGACSPGNIGPRSINPFGTLVHSTGGTDSLSWLITGSAASGNPASANCLIERNGTRHNLTPAGHYPYHAGVSIVTLDRTYTGDAVSQALIGVELEYTDVQSPSYEQIDSLAEYILAEGLVWGWRWPFIIYGHYGVARPLGRRSDPVSMDWGSLTGRLYVRAAAAQTPGLG